MYNDLFFLVNPNATQEEIKEMTESDKTGGSIFAQQVISGGNKEQAKRALQDIQDRHVDILRIEKSIIVSKPVKNITH